MDTRKDISKRLCEVKGCNKIRIGRGWCHMHYKRWQKYSDPFKVFLKITNLSFSRRDELIAHLISNRKVNGRCWEWTRSHDGKGYGKQVVDGVLFRIPRISAFLFLTIPIDTKLDICHHCDNRSCFNPEHLYEGTRKRNMLDRSVRGRHGIAKLTPESIRKIRVMIDGGASQSSIAKYFNVSQTTISNISIGKIWTHVV